MSQSNKGIATAIYALQAASFFLGFTFILALVINYVKRGDVRGSLAESHFTWQIRTCWGSVLFGFIGWMLIYVLIGFVILGANFLWVIYRIAKGWVRLADGKAMY